MGRLRSATDFWAGLAGPSRRLLIGAVVIFIVGLFLLMRVSGKVEYSTVATNVPLNQVQAMQKELDAAGIPNRTANGATAIEVPAGQVDQARIALVSGNSGTSPGWEIFDKSGFGDTDYTQQIKFVRAKEGEIERALTSMDQIESADVNIAVPAKQAFTSEQKSTTASVMLTMAPGQSLTPEQVGVVGRLVGAAVPDLDPKNVQITDTRGNTLAAADGTFSSQANTRIALETAYEQAKQRKLQGLMDQILGPGNAVVAYNATLDLDKRSVESETYQPKSKVPLEQTKTVEKMRNNAGRTGAVVGVTPNSPGNTFPQSNAAGGGRVTYDRTQDQVKNGVNRTRSSAEVTPGSIVNQSVAVTISDKVPAATVTALQDQIQKAIGFAANRDQVSVKQVAFGPDSLVVQEAQASGDAAAAEKKGLLASPAFTPVNIAKTTIAIIGLLLVLFLARRSLRRRQTGLEGILPELLESGPVPVAALQEPAAPQAAQLMGLVKSPIEKQMEELALRKPDDMAKLIRGWLTQR